MKTSSGWPSDFLVPAIVAIGSFVIRFIRVGTIENDHYVILSRAHQMLHGDWPVRDFVDPGMPLSYLLSAAAAVVGGPTLLTEAILAAALFALGIAVAFACIRRASGSTMLALVATAFMLFLPPRLYGSPKVLVPMIAMALAWNYADRPSSPSVMALGAWTGVAFLFRHDYAVYVAFASAAMLFVCHWSERSELVRRTSVFLVGLLAVVAPWLIYVQVHQGVMEYLASALRFSIVEGNRTVGRWPLVFYAMTAVPALAFLIGVRGTRTLTSAHVAFCCLLVLLSDLALLRDSAGSRLPDVYATTGVAVAVILGRLLSPRILRLANIVVVIVVAVAAIPLVARAASRHEVPDVVQRWRLVASRLREAREEIMPVPEYAAIVRYISRCTTPEDRILVGGFAPELAVLSHRAYAGGLPYWLGGYYEDEADVTRARRWLAGEQLGLALLLEGAESFAQSWPSIAADLRARGFKPYALTLPGERIEVWLPEVAASYRVDAETNLPCAASG